MPRVIKERTGIAHLLAELLALLFKLAGFLLLRIFGGATLADFEGHISVTRRRSWRRLVFYHAHITTREDTLQVGPLITTTPPYGLLLVKCQQFRVTGVPYNRHSCAPELERGHGAGGPDHRDPLECKRRVHWRPRALEELGDKQVVEEYNAVGAVDRRPSRSTRYWQIVGLEESMELEKAGWELGLQLGVGAAGQVAAIEVQRRNVQCSPGEVGIQSRTVVAE